MYVRNHKCVFPIIKKMKYSTFSMHPHLSELLLISHSVFAQISGAISRDCNANENHLLNKGMA